MLDIAASADGATGPISDRPRERRLGRLANFGARWLWSFVLLWLVAYLAIYLWHAWRLLRFPFALDQGEAYDAYTGWLVHLGQLIYSNNDLFPYFSSNYPPVYSYLISIPMAWLGPSIPAARLVSVISAMAVGGLITWIVWRERGSLLGSACAALLFFSSSYVFHTTPLARVNATTLLVSMAALAVLWRAPAGRMHWPALLLLVALYTKQTAIDAAAASALWLAAAHRWRDLGRLLALVGLPGLGLLLGLEWWSGGQFWRNAVVGNANAWDWHQAAAYYANFLEIHLVLLALALVQTAREVARGHPTLFGLYFCTAAALAVTAGKWGSGESYFLATIAAASIQSGRLLSVLPGQAALPRVAAGALLLAQCVLFAHGPLASTPLGRQDRGFQAAVLGWTPGPADIARAKALVDYAGRFGGPVLAESPDFVLEAGQPIIGNATHLRNLWLAGAWDSSSLVHELAARRYEFVFLEAHLYPPPVLEAIGRYYYLYDEVALRHRRVQVYAPGTQNSASLLSETSLAGNVNASGHRSVVDLPG